MPELQNFYQVTPRLMIARFPDELDPASPLDPGKWRIIGGDNHEPPIWRIMPAPPPITIVGSGLT